MSTFVSLPTSIFSCNFSLTAVGSSPNANAATLTDQVLNLEPASTGFPGVVTTGTQSFAGDKTFTGILAAANLSGTNSGNVTIGTANGLSLIGQALSLAPACSTITGALTSADWTLFNNTWSKSGNASTVAGTNFIGTTDNIDVVMKRQNTEWLRIATSGISVQGSNRNTSFTVNGNADVAFTGAVSANSTGFKVNNTQTNSTASPTTKIGLNVVASGSWAPTTCSNVYGVYIGAVSGACTSSANIDIGFSNGQDRVIQIDTSTTCGNNLTISAGNAASGGTNLVGGNVTINSGCVTGNASSSILLNTYQGVNCGSSSACSFCTANFGRTIQFWVAPNITGNCTGVGFQVNGANYNCAGPSEINEVLFALDQNKSICTSSPAVVGNQRVFRITAPTYSSGPCVTTFTKVATFSISGAPTLGANIVATSIYAQDIESGDLSLTNGSLWLRTASNGIKIKEGTNARMGQSTLVAGTVTVTNSSATTSTRIFLTRKTTGGTVGDLTYTVTGGSFTINSASATDTSLINWLLIEGL